MPMDPPASLVPLSWQATVTQNVCHSVLFGMLVVWKTTVANYQPPFCEHVGRYITKLKASSTRLALSPLMTIEHWPISRLA
jgi:hypothetical protein